MVNDQLSRIMRRWVYRVRPSGRPGVSARTTLRLEECEARLAPATLPAVNTSNTTTLTLPVNNTDTLNGFAPQAAFNPADPSKLILASSDGSGIQVSSSPDGGATWTVVYTTQRTSQQASSGRVIDPTLPTNSGIARVFTNTAGPSVAFGRDGYAYVVEVQSNAGKTSGAVVLHKFKFTPGDTAATVVDLDPTDSFGAGNSGNVVYRFTGQDPALNVAVGVDNNVPFATVGSSTFTDTLAAGKVSPSPIVPTTRLAADISTNAQTSITLGTTAGVTVGTYLLIDSELVRVTGGQVGGAGKVITVARAQAGTTAVAHVTGSVVQSATFLTGAISASDTTIVVNNVAGFPTNNPPFNILIDNEQMTVTAVAGNTWTVVRGVNGTTAAAHAANAITTGVPTTVRPPVYVAWNTNASDLSGAINRGGVRFNPTVILAAVSADGGQTFGNPLPVSDAFDSATSPGGYLYTGANTPIGWANPKIIFNQGDGTSGDGGQLTFAFNQLNGTGKGQLYTDISQPDGGVAGQQAATVLDVIGGASNLAPTAVQVPIVAVSTTTQDLLSSGNTVTVAPSSPQFQVGNIVRINAEIATVTQVVGNTLTLQRGSNPIFQASGSPIQVVTLLNSNIDNATTTIPVVTPSGFPTGNLPFDIIIDNEQMTVTAVNGNTWTVTRGVNSTTAAAHANGAVITGVANTVPGVASATVPVTIPTNFGTITDLSVDVSFRSPNIGNYSIVLVAPDGSTFTLLSNRNTAAGAKTAPNGGIASGIGSGNSIGYLNGSSLNNGVALTFSDYAPRSVNDPTNTTIANNVVAVAESSLVGTYRPDANFLTSQKLIDFVNQVIANLGSASGTWSLRITEFVATTSTPRVPTQLLNWGLRFTGAVTPGFGSDTPILETASSGNQPIYVALPGGVDNINPLNQDIVPTLGIGPGVSVAYDTTLFAAPANTVNTATQTAHPGRMYLAYTGFALTVNQVASPDSNDTDVFLIFSDDGGLSWSIPVRVNNDTVLDGTEGNRTQFQPSVAVDPLTGMVVVTWYDTRNDAGGGRAATYIATSIDGGNTFGPQSFLNTPKQATNAITGAALTIEPIPTNLQHADDPNGGNSYPDPQLPHGVGTQQAVLAYGGRINAFWTGTYSYNASGGYNPNFNTAYLGTSNAAGAAVYTATTTTAGGPRVDTSDQGSITTIGQFLETTGQAVPVPRLDGNGNQVSFITYNDRFATASTVDANNAPVAPGTRLLDGFIVRFDRTIDPTTFTGADIVVQWEKAALVGGVAPLPIDLTSLGVRYRVFVVPSTTYAANSVYFVQFVDSVTGLPKPQGGVGTYSYSVGPNIQDTVFNPVTGASGSFMDQNADGSAGVVQPGDVYAVPTPVNGGAFVRPYTTDTRPLIVPGPYVATQFVPSATDPSKPGQFASISTVTIDTTQTSNLLLTLTTAVLPSSFNVFSVSFQNIPIDFSFAVPVDVNGNPVGFNVPTRYYRIQASTGTSQFLPQGSYSVVLQGTTAGSAPPTVASVGLDTTQATALEVTFDRTVAAADFTAADITALNGPNGAVITTTTLAAALAGNATSLTVADASQFPLTGTFYRIQIGTGANAEVVTVLSRIGNVLTISRGPGAGPHSAGETVRLIPTIIPIDQSGNLTASPTRFFRVIPVLATGTFLPLGTYTGTADPTTPSADGQYLNTPGQAINIVFDRDMDVNSVTQFMQVQLNGANVPSTTLTAAITSASTTLTVASAAAFPTTLPYQILIDSEIMTVTAVNGNTLTVTRGASPVAHTATSLVSLYFGTFTVTQTGIDTRTFTITFPTKLTLDAAYSLVLSPVIAADGQPLGPKSTAGDAIDTNRNAGLDRLRSTSSSGAAIVTRDFAATFPDAQGQPNYQAIQPAGPSGTSQIDVPLNVGEDFVVTQDLARYPNQTIQVGFNINFQTVQDLQIFLVAPDGTSVLLYRSFQSNTGGTTGDFTGTILDDRATTPISLGAAPYNGTFNPQLPLSLFADVLGDGIGVQAKGTWKLRVINTGGTSGNVTNFSLRLPRRDTTNVTGLGEPVADQATIGLRRFYQDPTTVESQNQWTAVNTATNNGASAGQATTTAVDPSDASGNTVFVGGASGGVWRTTNFLTTDPKGPTWVPMTDGGPTYSLNVSSLAIIGRNNDTNQSIVFALTGEGNSGSPGVGLLRSMDGGKTWVVLDSTTNADSLGNILPITTRGNGAFQRDGIFYGATGFKVVADPTPISPGNYVVFMAVQGGAAQQGLWRSLDTGRTWTRIKAGQASDVIYAPGSADPNTGLLQRLYVAFQGDGVYYTFNAPGRSDLTQMVGGEGNNLIQDYAAPGIPIVTVNPPADTPNGAKGRIVLAVPGLQNSPLLNSFYQDWVYALVANPDGTMDGLYQTKDFGRNWVKVQLPFYNSGLVNNTGTPFEKYPTNNETRPELDLFSLQQLPYPVLTLPSVYTVPNYAMGLAIDPTNPNIVYAAGVGASGAPSSGGSIRIDVSAVNDHESLVFYDDSRAGQGDTVATATVGAAVGRPIPNNNNPQGWLYIPGGFTIYTNPDGTTTDFTNLSRDPLNPFVANASLRVGQTLNFTNNGENAKYLGFTDILNPGANSTTFGADFVKSIITFVDPLTGKTRLIYSTENGVFSGVDAGDGTLIQSVGFDPAVNNNRNGNLQLQQFTSGAVQPSQLAADLAGTMFFATGRDNGFAVSSNDVLQTGDTTWTGQRGSGVGVAIDPAGSGTSYQYRQPCCGGDNTSSATPGDFFRVLISGTDQAFGGGTGRTNGLLTSADNPGQGIGQWPQFDYQTQYNQTQVGYFAVNPVRADTDPNGSGGIVMGSGAGRVYLTSTLGRTWFPIAQPSDLDGTVASALAFGSPDPSATQAGYDTFIYAGMQSGRLYVTRTAGGTNGWTQINIPLDGTPIMKIDADTRRGSRDAFVVTQKNVFYVTENKTGANYNGTYTVTNVTGNLFTLGKKIFGDNNTGGGQGTILNALQYLTTIAVDWRFATPVDPNNPTGATYPNVYVGGAGGVFRSTNVLASGQTPTWVFYPDAAQGAEVQGGYLPDALVTDLDLATGAIDSTTGLSIQNSALNLLVATTYGRGQFAIRLNPNELPIYSFQPGPRVVSVTNPSPAGPSSSLRVTFNTLIDPNTFTTADVTLTGPNGPVTITGVTPVAVAGSSSVTAFDVTFGPVSDPGSYTLTVGPNISDPGGNLMNQNLTYPNGQVPSDAFTTNILLNLNKADTLSVYDPLTTQPMFPGQVGAGDATSFFIRALKPDGTVDTAISGSTNGGRVTLTLPPPSAGFAASIIYTDPSNPTGSAVTEVTLKDGVSDRLYVMFFEAKATGQSITFTSPTNSINQFTANTSVVAGVASSLTWSAPTPAGTTAQVNAPISYTLTAADAFGNKATAYNGQVTLTSSDPAALLGATGTTVLNGQKYTFAPGDNGAHAFTVRFQTVSAAGQIVTATDATRNISATTVPPIIVTPGPLATVTATVNPTSVIPGDTVTVTNITLKDAAGNTITNFNGTVTVSVTNYPAGSAVVTPDGSGGFTIKLNAAGSPTITVVATPSGGTAVSSAPTTVTVSAPVIRATASPTSLQVGNATTVTVRIVDSNGNVLTGFNGTVTLTSSDPAAVLPAADQPLVNGQLALPVTLNTPGTQTITATVTGPTGQLVSTPINIAVTRPVVPPPPTNNPPTVSSVPNQSAPSDGRIGPITFTISDPETPSSRLGVTFASSNPTVVPVANIASAGTGGTRTMTIQPGAVGTSVVSIIVTDAAGLSTTSQFTVTVTAPLVPPTVPPSPPPPPTPVPPPPASLTPAFAVSTGPGTQSTVTVYSANATQTYKDLAFGSGYTGGSRVALATDPDGYRLVTVAAPGRAPDMTVTNLSTGAVQSFLPFESSFTGGLFVATGDLNGDGYDDYVISPDQGGGPRVEIISGLTGQVLTNFFGIDDPNFRGGVRTAVGDVNGDGVPDVIVAAGFGGGPRVAIFDGRTVFSGTPQKLVNDFFAFEPELRNGAYVAAGDLNGDGKAEVIAGAGPGGGPRVVAFNGADLVANSYNLVADFLAGDVASRAGIPVATANLDGDNLADIVVGTGEGAGSRVTGYYGKVVATKTGTPAPAFSFDEEAGFKGGVFVG